MAAPNMNDVAGPLPGAVPPAPVAAPPVAAPGPAAAPPVPAPAPPGAGLAPGPAGPAPDPIAIAGQNLGESQAIGKEVNAATQEKTALEQELAAKKAQDDARHAQALDQFLQQQQLHRQAADAEISAKRQQYESAPFHSLWSTRSTGQKVAIALGILAGGIGWDSNHQNRALQVLQDAEQEDFARQKEQHADLWRDLQLSLDNRKELDARQLHELSDWQAQEGAKWAAVAGKLNAALAANKGRFESTDARKAALEATEKSNTAYQNAIAAKAAANHTDAQTRLELEQVKNQPGVRDKNAAEAEKFRAEAANNRAMAASGGLSKLDQAFLQKFDRTLNTDKDVVGLYGNDATPGPLRVLPRVAQLQNDIKEGVASRDNAKVLQSVIASKELLSKLLTGGQLNETKAKVLDSIQGSPSETQAKLNRILGDPQASTQLVHGIYGLLDDVREQNLKLTDDYRDRLNKKHLGTKNPLLANPAVRDAVKEKIEALTSDVKNGGGTPRYPEGGATPGQAKSAPAQSQYPVGTRAKSGGKDIVWNGSAWEFVK